MEEGDPQELPLPQLEDVTPNRSDCIGYGEKWTKGKAYSQRPFTRRRPRVPANARGDAEVPLCDSCVGCTLFAEETDAGEAARKGRMAFTCTCAFRGTVREANDRSKCGQRES